MPRKRRISLPGEIHHVMSRGIDGKDIFRDSYDYQQYLRLIASIMPEAGCRCYAWALLPNHYHLVLRPLDVPLGNIMLKLNSKYARYFNKRHNRRGYLFQDRYKSLATQDFGYFRELIRYVHLNPLRVGLVRSYHQLKEYPFCGHGAIIGNDVKPWMAVKETLSKFSLKKHEAVAAYERFLSEGISAEYAIDEQAVFSLLEDINPAHMLDGEERLIGEASFIRNKLSEIEKEKVEARKRLRNRPTLKQIASDVIQSYGIEKNRIFVRGRQSDASLARATLCQIAHVQYCYSYVDIAGFLGISPSGVSQAIRRCGK